MGKKKRGKRKADPLMIDYAMVPRERAVKAISATYGDKTDIILAGPLDRVGGVLQHIPSAVCYLDAGTRTILVTRGTGETQSIVLYQISQYAPMAAIIAIPKATPETALTAAGIDVTGSEDICLVASNDDQLMCYPILLVDAIDLMDPVLAAQLRAQGVKREFDM